MKAEQKSTEYEKFDALVRKVIAVPHSEINARMEEWKKERKRKKRTQANRKQPKA
jgi:hypothetical protein